MHKECVAMLLAGGKGSRLGILTKNLAKPAVPFGGKYRIIDFTLSNCCNSGLDTVGVLTQYQPLKLNSYIGIGSPWNLDRKNGGVTLLPPYEREVGKEWYKGTANAIYQNINFIDEFTPQHLLVLSGDHIYKMDYSVMLQWHKEKNADATIAVIEVPWEDAGNFGILSTDEGGRIIEFEEKPVVPKSNYASMGVYIFNWELLVKYLEEDEQDPYSDNDFGKNVIPKMLRHGQRLFAYPFKDYWKDVGSIESLWQAHMDLLQDEPALDLYDPKWRIYSQNPTLPAHYLSSSAKVTCSLINEGCFVRGSVEYSVLFPGVYVGEGAEIKDSIIMPNARIGSHVKICKSIICESTVIQDYCHIGIRQEEVGESCSRNGITVVGGNGMITRGTIIPAGMRGSDCDLGK